MDPKVLLKAQALVMGGIFSTILLKIGRHGVVIIDASRTQHCPIPAGNVRAVSTTGCGDSFAGAFTATLSHLVAQMEGGMIEHGSARWYDLLHSAVEVGQLAARKTLASTKAVGDGMQRLLQDRR